MGSSLTDEEYPKAGLFGGKVGGLPPVEPRIRRRARSARPARRSERRGGPGRGARHPLRDGRHPHVALV